MSRLSHVGADGRAHMVDVSAKPDTVRVATASGRLRCRLETVGHVRSDTAPKGAVLSTAELAGIMAAKRTADLVPLCHPLALAKVAVSIRADDGLPGFQVEAEVRTKGPTGVEMEALTAVTVACLTLFDMLKALDRSMVIEAVRVTSKSGGRSGAWKADPE
jgi:cyclic pyranopterin phosphate synthase